MTAPTPDEEVQRLREEMGFLFGQILGSLDPRIIQAYTNQLNEVLDLYLDACARREQE